MKRRIFLNFAVLSLFCSCKSSENRCINYNEHIIKAQECVNNFYFYDSPKSLDSAYLYLSEVKNGYCSDSNRLVKLHMSTVYFLKGEFKNAIKIYDSLDASEFSFPEYKNIIINKIKAKEAGTNERYAKRMEYYSAILADLDLFLNRNIPTRDSILRLSDMATLNSSQMEVLSMFVQRYYYANKTQGLNKTISELDSLQKAINGNPAYFDYLKKSLTGKDGHRISVEFE